MASRSPRTAQRRLPGPYVAALLCERVLTEKDESISAIRIIDQLTLGVPPGVDLGSEIRVPATIFLLATVRGAPTAGPHTLEIRTRSPDGRKDNQPPLQVIATAPPPEALGAANVIAQLNLGLRLVGGIYWFDVHLDGKFRTSVPLLVQVGPAIQGMPPAAVSR